jgi:hypothetical protein
MPIPQCTVCGKSKSRFIMNNKTVCMRCDELLFDLEIECEEVEVETKEKPVNKPGVKPTIFTAKK